MRRSALVGCVLGALVLSVTPDAAFVPRPRAQDAGPAAARAVPVARGAASVGAPVVRKGPSSSAVRIAAPANSPTPSAVQMAPAAVSPRTPTTTTLTSAPNPAGIAQAFTLTATVAVIPPGAGTPTGKVRFLADGSIVGEALLSAGGAAAMTTSGVVAGTRSLTAHYVGDAAFAPSTSAPVAHVTSTAAASTITLGFSSPSPSAAGSPFTALALVVPLGGGVPTGTVQFFDGATAVGSGTLSTLSGYQIAFVTLSPGTAGTRTLTAKYLGAGTFGGSTSTPWVQTIYSGAAPAATTTTLAATPSAPLVGQSVQLTATVTRTGGGTPTGAVDFFANGQPIGSAPLAAAAGGAQAVLTYSALPKGMHLVSSSYAGAGTSAGSSSSPLFLCVDCSAANATPLSEAGGVQVVAPGTTVQLDGSASSDLEGAPLAYTWTPVAGAPFVTAVLSDPVAPRPTFVAAAAGWYAFDLVVNDGTSSSPPDRVYVFATTYTNLTPIANAGADQFVEAGQGVQLASASVDPDAGPAPLTHRWLMVRKPTGSAAELTSATVANPQFFLDLEGTYEFELIVSDGISNSVPDRVIVATNHIPVAAAGFDQAIQAGSTVRLNGGRSTDVDGQMLTYEWTLTSRPAGSTAAIDDPSGVLPSFVADLPGAYVVRLVVHDGVDPSVPDFVTFSTGNLAPIAAPGPDRRANVGQAVQLDGTGSWDPNGNAITYSWTLLQRPGGSTAVVSGAAAARASLTPDVAGDYIVRLVVSDGALASDAKTVRVTTGNTAPVAQPGADRTFVGGDPVQVDGSGSTDVDGNSLAYDYHVISVPPGSVPPGGSVLPRFSFGTGAATGTFVVQLRAFDGAAYSEPRTVIATTENVAPVARAGADQAVSIPSAVTLDGSGSFDANSDTLTYQWSLISRPAGSAAVLGGATTASPTFFADAAGDYVAQLIVSDGLHVAPADTVLVTTGNAAPFANPGPPQLSAVGAAVSLDGTGSADANGDGVTFEWSLVARPGGSAAALSDPAAAEPTFVPDLGGDYVAQLIVSDGALAGEPRTVLITAVPAPAVDVAVSASALVGETVPLDAVVTNPSGLPLTFAWSFGSKPAGSAAAIANPSLQATSFVPDLAGVYVLCLVASNGVESAPDCAPVTVTAPPSLALTPAIVNLAAGGSAVITVTSSQPAGPGGIEVALASSGSAAVSVPASITIAEAATTATFTATAGAVEGIATISAAAAGYASDTTHVNVSISGITITLGAGLVVAPEQVRDLPLTLSSPAPPGGVQITLASSDAGVASVTSSVYVPEGSSVPTGNPQVRGQAFGMAEITASAAGLSPDTEIVAVARGISLSPSPLTVVNGGTATLTLRLSAPAPGGGLGFTVTAGSGAVAAPAAVTVLPNQLTAPIVVTGQAVGSTSIDVTPTDSADTSTASVAVSVVPAQPINLQSVSVGKDLQASLSGNLGAPAPAGNLVLTIASADPSKVLLATSSSATGSGLISVTVPAGTTAIPSFYVQALAEIGSVQLTASAGGYPDATSVVTLTPSGFIFGHDNFTTGVSSPNTPLTLHAVRLETGSLAMAEYQALRPGVNVSLALTSSNTGTGIVTSPVAISGPSGDVQSAFDPVAGGSTQLTLAVPPGFSAPASGTQITVTVAAPLQFPSASLTVGRNLQAAVSLTLGSPAPAGNLALTIASGDPARVLLSTTPTGAGAPSIAVTVPAGSTASPAFYIQGLDESGAVQVTATATSYEAGTLTVNLAPSGIVFVTGDFVTHPGAPNTTLTLQSVILEPGTLAYLADDVCSRCQPVRGGLSFGVTVSSSDNPVGVITGPAAFSAGGGTATTAFDPATRGTATLSIAAPPGSSTPANGAEITATVTVATATLTLPDATIGKNLQIATQIDLGEPAPAGNLVVTIASADPSKVLLATAPTGPAMASISVTVPAGSTTSPQLYVQALDETGAVTLSATAPAYFDDTATITLRPAGFVFVEGDFSTTTLSGDTSITVRSVWLNPGTLDYVNDLFCTRCLPVRSGLTADVPVVAAPTTVGTITISPVSVGPATGIGTTAFHPLSGGTATITLGSVPGFSNASNFNSITATVDSAALTLADLAVGKDLQTPASVTLGAPAPSGGASVTVTSGDPGSVLLSATPGGSGAAAITIAVGAGATSSPTFYVRALGASGATQLSAAAAGYASATGTVSLKPSGFVFVTGDFTTGALSPNTPLEIRSVWLEADTLMYLHDPSCTRCQAVRPGLAPIDVALTSSDTGVGAVTGPAVFNGGDAVAATEFDPLANGATTLAIVAPPGFSAPSNLTTITATVQPAVTVGSATIGRDLQSQIAGSLAAAAPAGNLVVTLQSSDPTKLLLALTPTDPGQASINITVAAGASTFSFHAQSLAATGTAQIVGSAPGYLNGDGTVTFRPSGFVLDRSDFTISPSAVNASLPIRSVRLDPDFLNYLPDPYCSPCQAVRPGVSVTPTVISSDTAVGTIVGTASFTGGVSLAVVEFDPQAVGTSTVSLDAPPPAPFSTPSNFQQITVTVAVPPPTITIADVTVGKDLQAPVSGALGAPAPAGNLSLTINSADPDKVLLSTTANVAGSASITLTIPGGSSTIPTFYVQALSATGTVALTGSAAGYETDSSTVTLWPSGFVITTADFATSPVAQPVEIEIRSVRVDPLFLNYTPDGICSACQNVRAGLTASVAVASSNPAIGTITVSPVVFNGNEGVKTTGFDGSSSGTADVSLTAPPGFETPSNFQSVTATVTNSYVAIADVTVGKDLQASAGGSLGEAAPAGNLEVTITSSDPSKVIVSAAASAPGSASITLVVPAGATTLPTFYVQGLANAGTAQLLISAPGHVSTPATVTLVPSGFVFITAGDFTTTSFSENTPLQVASVRLEPTTLNALVDVSCSICQAVRAGLTPSVFVTSSDEAIGTIANSPLTFDSSGTGQIAIFDPANGGSTTLAIGVPAGFSQPASHRQIVATVTAPPLTVSPIAIGSDLQQATTVTLGAPAPPGNLSVTITSADPARVLLSANATSAGSTSITLTVGAGNTTTPEFYVHALAGTGTVDVTASAAGYASGTGAITLRPSAFLLNLQSYWCIGCYPNTFTTTTGSANTGFYVVAVRLAPGTLNYEATQQVRGGANISVPVVVTSTVGSDVGTIVTSPFTFTGGDTYQIGGFDPQNAGTATIAVQQPAGFSTPSNFSELIATVTAPTLSVGDVTVGKDLQTVTSMALGEPAPTGGIEVTLTSGDPSKVLLSTGQTTAGAGSITLNIPAGQSTSTGYYVQALADTGTVQITATASGYAPDSGTVTLAKSGFIVNPNTYWCVGCYGTTLATTTGAADQPLVVVAALLNSGNLEFQGSQEVRGGASVSVTLTVTDTVGTGVGALTVNPVVLTGGQIFNTTAFDPQSGGTAVVAVSPPPGFSAASTYNQLTFNVTAPALTLGDFDIGKNLQVAAIVSLGEPAPPGGISVTVTSGDSSKVLLSAFENAAGGASVTLNVDPGGTSTPQFYVQVVSDPGPVQLTASATGFSQTTGTVTIKPSGFVINQYNYWCVNCYGVSFTATSTGPNHPLTVSAARLNPSTSAFELHQGVRGGLAINVPVTSTDTSGTGVGAITITPLVFDNGALYRDTAFDPINPGTAVLEVGTPAGFTTPSDYRQITATVTAPALSLNPVTVGKDLQTGMNGGLTGAAPGGDLAVTITSSDATKLLLSNTMEDAGSASIVVTVPAGSTAIPTFHVQGLASSGSADVTASATGYNNGTATVPLYPSGFVMTVPPANFSTTTLSAPTAITVQSAALLPATLQYQAPQPLRPGASASVSVTATDASGTGVGTITISPLAFTAGQGVAITAFDPASAGSSVIAVQTPPGFTQPSNLRVVTATVTTASMAVSDVSVGKDLQTTTWGSLEAPAPSGGLTVTVTSADPAAVLLSADPALVGSASIPLTIPEGSNAIPPFWVQAIGAVSTATLNVTAPGFAPETATVTILPSGFIILSPGADFTTSATAGDTTIRVAPAQLTPGTLQYLAQQPVRAGATVNVEVLSSDPSAGTIAVSPLTFTGGDLEKSTAFQPQPVVAPGTSTITVGTPPGFSTPGNLRQITATVNPG